MNSCDAYYLTYDTGVSSLELETIISKDGYNSSMYAKYVLKGRFELGEEMIGEDGYYSLRYAKQVLKGRFILGERLIGESGYFSYFYAKDVMRYDHD